MSACCRLACMTVDVLTCNALKTCIHFVAVSPCCCVRASVSVAANRIESVHKCTIDSHLRVDVSPRAEPSAGTRTDYVHLHLALWALPVPPATRPRPPPRARRPPTRTLASPPAA